MSIRRFLSSEKGKAVTAYCIIVLISFARAMNLYVFILPHAFAPGGITGLATILNYLTEISSGIFLLILNLPLIILAFFKLSKRYAFRTALSTLITSGFLFLLDFLTERGVSIYQYEATTDLTPFLSAAAAGVISGFILSIQVRTECSSAGTDVIAAIIHKKHNHTNITVFIGIMDSVVIFISFFVYGMRLEPVILALILTFVSSKAGDVIISGLKNAIKFEIITNDPKAIADRIFKALGRGVTKVSVVGMYENKERSMLICVVRKRQAAIVKGIIKEYPDSFAFISGTSDVIGYGFHHAGTKSGLF